jgi:microcystin degradation protein MlrC
VAKRVLLARLAHETHTFLRGRTGLADFKLLQGEAVLETEGDGSTLAGSLGVARERAWEVVPAVAMDATPGGMVTDEVVEAFWTAFRGAAEQAAPRGIEGICVNMHGAMVSDSYPDVEGELLRRIRSVPALADVPLCGALDLHGNYSAAMVRLGSGLVAYRENPHTDSLHTAVRAARLLDRLMETGERPMTVCERPPIVWPPSGTGTADEPMRTLEARARAIEAAHPEILAVNVFAGFSFADVPETGVSFSATTVGDPHVARAALRELCALAMELRDRGEPKGMPLEQAMARLAAHRSGPALLVEPADNIGGGAPGDLTTVLQALLEHRIENAAVCIYDLEAVGELWDAAPGEKRRLPIGGKSGEIGAAPLVLEVEVISRSDGRYLLEDPHSHAAAWGLRQEMGPCVVVRCAGVRVLLTSRRTAPWDLAQWRSQGITPESLFAIGIKAAVAHRQAYDPIAAASCTLDTPGPCAENLRRLPFRHIRRPIHPLDDLAT